jgi:hypothetical protein
MKTIKVIKAADLNKPAAQPVQAAPTAAQIERSLCATVNTWVRESRAERAAVNPKAQFAALFN